VGGYEENGSLTMPPHLSRQMALVFEVLEYIRDYLCDVLLGYGHDRPVYGVDRNEELTITSEDARGGRGKERAASAHTEWQGRHSG
jgi:hypothetical protein